MPSALIIQPSRRAAEQCALLLLLAWLPTLAFAGHWGALAAPITGSTPAPESHASRESHRQHCHADLEGCADGASTFTLPTSPAKQAGVDPTEATVGAPIANEDLIPSGRIDAPLTPPPRHAR